MWILLSLILLRSACKTGTYRVYPIQDYVYYPSAKRQCEKLGNGWHLPNGQNFTKQMKDVMIENEIKAIWITIRRKKLPMCKWVNGANCTYKCPSQTDVGCNAVSLGHGNAISSHLCADEEVGRICEFSDCLINSSSSQQCVGLRHPQYDVACNAQNWYKARLHCKRKGGHLAVLDDVNKLDAITNNLAERLYTFTCSSFYIGLHCEEWQDSENKDLESLKEDYWDVDEPSDGHDDCTKLVINDIGEGKWRTTSCFLPNQAICESDSSSDTALNKGYEPPFADVTCDTKMNIGGKPEPSVDTMMNKGDESFPTGRNCNFWRTTSIVGSGLFLVTLLILIFVFIERLRKKQRNGQDATQMNVLDPNSNQKKRDDQEEIKESKLGERNQQAMPKEAMFQSSPKDKPSEQHIKFGYRGQNREVSESMCPILQIRQETSV